MKILVILSLILVVSTFSLGASSPIQLNGDAGKAILVNLINNTSVNSVNSTLNQTINASQPIDTTANQVSNASTGGLWNWGTAPAGHTVDKSGNLVMVSGDQEWTPNI